MNWRRWNNVLHRDIGYVAVGLSIVYGVSGAAVNHVRDWNPSYRVQKHALAIEPIRNTDRIDLPTGMVIVEQVQPRRVLFEMNQMHLNTPKRAWTIIADVYAVSLIVLAVTGMFVLKGKTGITRRGGWLTGVGVILPVGYWLYHLYLEWRRPAGESARSRPRSGCASTDYGASRAASLRCCSASAGRPRSRSITPSALCASA